MVHLNERKDVHDLPHLTWPERIGETSAMLHRQPALVRGDPARGSPGRGKELFEASVAALAAFIRAWETATT